jgi:hypothetical protein
VLWILILLLIIKSFTRIVQIIILIACAPIAGALLMDRSTSSRFRSWFEKLIELLLSQINLAIIFIVITAILQPYAGRGAGDTFVSFLLSIVMMGMALSGKSVIGVAGAAMSGSGNGVLSFLKYQVVGGALRKAIGGRGRAGEGYAGTSTTDPHLRAGLDLARRGARVGRTQHACQWRPSAECSSTSPDRRHFLIERYTEPTISRRLLPAGRRRRRSHRPASQREIPSCCPGHARR